MESREYLRFDTDYFGVLPKHLVCNILSKLPTKDAIKTSILSRSWRFLWTTITILDFSDRDIFDDAFRNEDGGFDIAYRDASFKCFTDRVNGVLSQLKTPSIDKLSILLTEYSDHVRVEEWICAALKRNVRDLGLSAGVFPFEDYLELPRQVFDCKSLEALTLSTGVFFNIPHPEFVCFPNLKFLSLDSVDIGGIPAEESAACFPKLETLRLNYVTFVGRDDCVMKLLSNCPVLKNLCIAKYGEYGRFGRYGVCVSNADMCIPSLKSVDIFLGRRESGCQRIEAPIKRLRVRFNHPTQSVFVKNLDSLIAVELGMKIFSYPRKPQYVEEKTSVYLLFPEGRWDQIKLLKSCEKVKCLALLVDTVYAIQASNIELPLFCNLTHLVVVLSCNELCVLRCLVNNSVNLQNLIVIKKVFDLSCPIEDKQWFDMGSATDIEESRYWNVPKCLLTSLKWAKIQNSSGCSCDLNMIRYFLKCAQILKRLVIKCKSEHPDSVRDKISAFPLASAACQVDFDVVNFSPNEINFMSGRNYFEDIIIPRSMEHEGF